MHLAYRLLTTLLTPLALLRLQRGPGERGRWRERLGRFARMDFEPIWMHAASVGEINAAQGLIAALLERGEPVLVSTMTATGAARCRELFGTRVSHRYLALDNPFSTRTWLDRCRPRLGIIVETEIWPELYHQCHRAGVPLVLVSARVSPSAMRRYRRFPRLFGPALDTVALAACQSPDDAQRLGRLGLPGDRVIVTGNLKFDLDLPEDLASRVSGLRKRWGQRPVWVAGSSRPGEEEILIEAHRQVLENQPRALLVLAPRHPQRAAELARVLDRHGMPWCRFDENPDPDTATVLVDRLGVLMDCYGAADAAFVGGSLVARGGHNLIEPAMQGKPVLAGPHLDQQADAAAALSEADGLVIVNSAEALAAVLVEWLSEPEQASRIGAAAKTAVAAGRGSLDATLAALRPWLSRANAKAD